MPILFIKGKAKTLNLEENFPIIGDTGIEVYKENGQQVRKTGRTWINEWLF